MLISVTGILAFNPTKVPYYRKGAFLGDRDFFDYMPAIMREINSRCRRLTGLRQYEKETRTCV